MLLVAALLENPSLYLAPYVPSIVPSVLTCLLGKHLGSASQDGPTVHFALRDFSSSLLSSIARKYGSTSSTLKPRIARSCLKHFLDSHKPWGTHYGAILGLTFIAGAEGVRSLIIPNLKVYDLHLQRGFKDDSKREQAEYVVDAIIKALEVVEKDAAEAGGLQQNGYPEGE